jgi:hypothetical protein
MTDRDPSDDIDDPLPPSHGDGPSTADDEPSESGDDDPGWPWSFILLVVAGALYLIFRFAELAINLLS